MSRRVEANAFARGSSVLVGDDEERARSYLRPSKRPGGEKVARRRRLSRERRRDGETEEVRSPAAACRALPTLRVTQRRDNDPGARGQRPWSRI